MSGPRGALTVRRMLPLCELTDWELGDLIARSAVDADLRLNLKGWVPENACRAPISSTFSRRMIFSIETSALPEARGNVLSRHDVSDKITVDNDLSAASEC